MAQIYERNEPRDHRLRNAHLVDTVHEMAANLDRAEVLACAVQWRQFAVHPEAEGGQPAGSKEGRRREQHDVRHSFAEVLWRVMVHDQFKG